MSATYPLPTASPSRLGPHAKHSPRNPCPVCGDTTSYCITFVDGATICGHTPSEHPAGLGHMHWPQGRPVDWRERLASLPPPPPRPVVDAALADRAYRALLARCPLSEKHRADLHARGLTDEQIARHGYGTGPANQAARLALAAAVAGDVGQELVGQAPGFVRNRHGQRDLMCGDAELLIPVHDVQGRVAGVRRRLDDAGDGGKYRWLSGGDQEKGGISVDGHTLHVAQPAHRRTDRVLIVEGEIKANITADYFGCIVLAVPGVGNTNQVLATLAALNAKAVTIAYDKDTKPKTIENVAAAETKLARRLIDAGYQVAQWTWGAEEAKGIDDLLTAGLLPFPIPHPAISQAQTSVPIPTFDDDGAQRLKHERDAAVLANRARARIQRNTKLPARPMAIAVAGLFAHAATASKPAGDYDGVVPAGYVSAPVGTLAFDAGTQSANAGKQLERLEAAGIIARTTCKETLLAGQIDPETGEHLTTPRVFSRHFLAIAGHEQEPITPALVNEVVERMATFDSGVPEKRGGRRLRRCPDHPHADVLRHWSTCCSECGLDLDAGGPEAVPTMLLEPLPPHPQSLLVRDEDSDEDAGDDDLPLRSKTPLGIRPNAHEDHQRGADAAHQQTLTVRQRAAADDLLRFAKPLHDLDPDPVLTPIVTLFPMDVAPECEGCGTLLSPGLRHCRDCDPYTA